MIIEMKDLRAVYYDYSEDYMELLEGGRVLDFPSHHSCFVPVSKGAYDYILGLAKLGYNLWDVHIEQDQDMAEAIDKYHEERILAVCPYDLPF